jgi:hypothetical protein
MYRTIPTAIALLVFATVQSSTHAQPPQDLVLKTPDWANGLVVVDLKALLASPLAQREGWANKPVLDTLGGALPFPKGTEAVLLAARLEPGTLRTTADLALIQGQQLPTMPELAKHERKAEDIIAGLPAVTSGKNSIFVSVNPNTLAVFAPANRQDAARWIRFAQQNKSPAISGYLNQATNALKDGYHIVVALDLTDAVDPNLARAFLANARALKDKKVDMNALIKVLTSVRGIRIGVRIDQNIKAVLAGDFSDEIKPFADLLPALLLNALDEMGGELDEFPAGNASIQDKTFLITSQLTPQGLRKVLSLVPPVTAQVAAAKEVAPPPLPREPGKDAPAPVAVDPVEVHKRYFDRVYQIAVEAHTNADKRSDFMRAVSLYEKAASQIDKLPAANVDQELLVYAQQTSIKLRDIADALRASYAEAMQLEGQKRYNVQVVPGGFLGGFTIGPWNWRNPGDPTSPRAVIYPYITPDQYRVQSNDQAVQTQQNEILQKGLKKRSDAWRAFTDETAALRKNLSAKYKTAF